MSSWDEIHEVLGIVMRVKKSCHVWYEDWRLQRKQYSHIHLPNGLKFTPKDLAKLLRMDEDTFLNFLSMHTPLTKKNVTLP